MAPLPSPATTDRGAAAATRPGPSPLRCDAQRNRDRILDVAGEVFASQGLRASMNDIAAAAGVGVGTVYRRFPERADLVRGVFEQRLAGLERMALQAEDHPDPWAGIVWLLEETIALEAIDRGLTQLLDDESLRKELIGRTGAFRPAVSSLIERAQQSGQLRGDVGIGDFLVVKRMLTAAASATRSVRPEYWRRMLALCLAGLAAPGTAPLPDATLSIQEIDRARDSR